MFVKTWFDYKIIVKPFGVGDGPLNMHVARA